MSEYYDARTVPVTYWMGKPNMSDIAAQLGISRPTLYAALKDARLLFNGESVTYTPAPVGRPVGPARRTGDGR